MFSCRKFLNVYSLRRPTLSTRTASPLALVLHHLILDVLTHLRRRTSPAHPYPTVTYGQWYVFHDPPPLMSPSPSLTFKVSFVVYVVSTIAAITTQVPLAVWQFLPKVLSLSHFFKALRGRLQCSSKTFQMVTGFKRTVHLIRVAHRSKI